MAAEEDEPQEGGKYCISCGENIKDEAEICPECGVNQSKLPESGTDDRSENEKFCTSCGEIVNRDAEICPNCGVRQAEPATASGSESGDVDRTAAGLLAILLGGLGVHKFYMGDTAMGVLYLCFSWTLIPALIGLVEGIVYLTKSDAEFQAKYVD